MESKNTVAQSIYSVWLLWPPYRPWLRCFALLLVPLGVKTEVPAGVRQRVIRVRFFNAKPIISRNVAHYLWERYTKPECIFRVPTTEVIIEYLSVSRNFCLLFVSRFLIIFSTVPYNSTDILRTHLVVSAVSNAIYQGVPSNAPPLAAVTTAPPPPPPQRLSSKIYSIYLQMPPPPPTRAPFII